MTPFRQIPFDRLPELPRRPHRFFELEEKRVDVRCAPFGNVSTSYREHGEGEPLLLVHGLMTTGYSWRYLIEPLARPADGPGYRVIVPDLVGCGRSGKPDCRYGARDVAAFLAAFQRELSIRGCAVVGNSMGGYLCMWLALDDPEAIARLVNIHSPGVPMTRLWALQAALGLPGGQGLLSQLVARDPYRWAHARTHYWDESLKSLEEAQEYGAPLATEDGRRAFARYLGDTLHPRDMRSFVARLRSLPFPVPLELIYARTDKMVPPSVGKALHRLVPRAGLSWLEDCSHFAHVDRPDAVAAAVLKFVRS